MHDARLGKGAASRDFARGYSARCGEQSPAAAKFSIGGIGAVGPPRSGS